MSKSKAVAKKKAGKKPATITPMQQAMAEAAGQGNETLTTNDLAIPFIRILQDLSPQTKKRDEAFVQGAESGHFFNSVSQDIWEGEDGILFIPCHYVFMVNEWIKRKHGGGFVASHKNMSDAIENCTDAENHDLVDTHQHAILIRLPDGTWTQAIFPMKSTAIKASKNLNTLVSGRKGTVIDAAGGEHQYDLPRFASIWKMTTAERSNDQGDFFVPKIPVHEMDLEDMGEEGEALFHLAQSFYRQCSAGEANVDYRRMEDADDEGEADKSAPGF